MAFVTKDYRQIRADILRDIANNKNAVNAYVGDDSDYAIRANATASSIEGLYEHQQWIARQIFPDTADVDVLETRHAAPRGINRKGAAFATGTIRISGSVGSTVPIGTEAKSNSGLSYLTTAACVIGAGGSADIAAKAALPGLAGNQGAGAALTLTAAPRGTQSQAAIVGMTGGTDIETPDSLLARVMFDIRLPPSGGAKHDYYKWALDVPGVTDAYVFVQRRVINGIDVVIETNGGLPSAQLIIDVTAHINANCPPCVDLLVMAPTLLPVNIAGQMVLSGTTLPDALVGIDSVLQAYFATLQVGDVVRRVKLESLITSVRGVLDVTLTSPLANVVPRADNTHSELAILGTVALTL